LKASFTTAPFFIHVDLSKPFVLEIDTFNFTLSVVFSQPKENNLFHLGAANITTKTASLEVPPPFPAIQELRALRGK
jgi:hypothetical protein